MYEYSIWEKRTQARELDTIEDRKKKLYGKWERMKNSRWQSRKINKPLVYKVSNIWSINIISMKISIWKPNINLSRGNSFTMKNGSMYGMYIVYEMEEF